MRPDIDELAAFYGSPQGQLARRLFSHQIRALWPDVTGMTVLGLGYATPFLGALDRAERAIGLMPATQGAARWAPDGRNRVALAREDELPLADGSIDRVLLVHALECAQHLSRLLREVWRVCADGGRILAIVPNRRGLWCWSDRTPFGYGQPYSIAQLQKTLQRHLFAPVQQGRALYLPPTTSTLLLRAAIPAERLGLRLMPQIGGVIMIEAEKRIYVGRPVAAARRAPKRRYVPVPQGAMARRTHGRELVLTRGSTCDERI